MKTIANAARRLRLGIAALFLVSMSSTALAQRADGNIAGAAAPGDAIHVSNADIGFKRDVVATDEGKYTLRHVPLGEYEVVVSRNDAPVLKVRVMVRPGLTARVPNPPAEGTAPAAAAKPASDGD